jgi:hypothetical protein
MESKVFDTSTIAGIRQAESFKRRLEKKFDKVVTVPVGLSRVRIEGRS